MKTRRQTLLIGLALIASATVAPAQTTAFTYQGRLNDGTGPANGTYNLRFALFDALTVGNQVGSPLTNAPVSVSNGLFTVTLDFGANFPGAGRWLEIGVRTNGGGAFSTLSPRQPITPSPYAIAAGAVTGGVAASQVTGTIPLAQLPAALVTNGASSVNLSGNVSGTFTGNGAGLTGLNAASLTGTVPDARLSANVALLASSPTFTGPVTIANPGVLNFGATTRQMINLWNGNYGLGVQNNTLYQRSDSGFAWFNKGVHSNNAFDSGTGGTNLMWLDASGNLFANSSISVDVAGANNGSYYPGLVFGYGSGEAISSQRGTNGSNRYGIDFYTGFSPRLSIAGSGNIGIGTATPQGKLDINTGVGTIQFRNDSGFAPGISLTGGGNPGTMRLRNTLEIWPSDNGLRAGYLDVRGTSGATTIQLNGANGEATVKVLTVTGGADIAEPFQISGVEIPQGAVVVIDEENPGRLKMSQEAYDTRVAGIVSGANGVKPGLSLQQEGTLDQGQQVALTGRAYALADASQGAIRPGDLLTTSDTPGHAMKVRDPARAPGAVIGKAMTPLKEGKGMVLVLVNLQ